VLDQVQSLDIQLNAVQALQLEVQQLEVQLDNLPLGGSLLGSQLEHRDIPLGVQHL
jgi:hypothetical protein